MDFTQKAMASPILWIGIGIVCAYLLALWGLLRREPLRTRLALLVLTAAVFASRVVWYDVYPPGLHEDEPKLAVCSHQLWMGGRWRAEGCTGLPALLWVVFRAPLQEWFGPTRWALRAYSVATGTAAIPVAFALARRIGFDPWLAGAAAALLGFLPWSLFYGRVNFGGELVFHQFLLLAGIATLVFRSGSLCFGLFLAVLGQSLLLYDYFVGRLFAPFALLAAMIAKGRARLLCLLVPVLSLLAWLPYLTDRPVYVLGPRGLAPPVTDLVLRLPQRLFAALQVFILPLCTEASAISLRAAAVHPPAVLALAVLGLAFLFRRQPRLGLFLSGGFCLGVLPAVVTAHMGVSSHRLLMAYPFVALAAVAALQPLSEPRARKLAVFALVLTAAGQSLHFFFSPRFWYETSRLHYGWENTQLLEAVPRPAPGRVYWATGLAYWGSWRAYFDPSFQLLTMADWIPEAHGPTLYLFSAHAEFAKGFFRDWLGPDRMHEVGRAFAVRAEPADRQKFERNGWSYAAACDGEAFFSDVPAPFQPRGLVPLPRCRGETLELWRGVWRGPPSMLRAEGADALLWIRVGQRVRAVERPGLATVSLEVAPGDTVELAARHPPANVWVALVHGQPPRASLPAFAWVEPLRRCEDPWSVIPPLSAMP